MEEKEMIDGLTFKYNNKTCVGIIKDEMIYLIDPEQNEMTVEKKWIPPDGFYWKDDERLDYN